MSGFTPANDNVSDDWFDALLGRAMRRLREERGLTTEQLARRAGLAVLVVERYEAGEWRMPSSHLIKLADVLEAPLAEFLEVI